MQIRRLAPIFLLGYTVLGLSACFDPSIPDNAFLCDEATDRGCPSGFTCVAGKCREGSGPFVDMTTPDQAPPSEGSVPDSTVDVPIEGSVPDSGDDAGDDAAPDAGVDAVATDTSVDTLAPDTTEDTLSPDTSVDTLSPDTSVDTLSPDTSVDTLSPDTSVDSAPPPDLFVPLDTGIPACPATPVPLGQVVTDGPSRFDITVDSNGVPHIIVAEQSTELVLLTVDGVLSSEALTPTAHHAGITFDGSGQLHMVYSSTAHTDLMYYQRRDAAGNWNTARELKIGYGVIVNSLDIDARGTNIVAIGEGDRPDGWSQKLVVDLAPNNPHVCSGTLGSGSNRWDHVRIAVGPTWAAETRFQETSSPAGSLYLLRWDNGFGGAASCSTSEYRTIASLSAHSLLAVAMDGNDTAHCVYVDPNTPNTLHYMTWNGVGSDAPTDLTPLSGAIIESVDIAASSAGTGYIAYQNIGGGGAKTLHVLERSSSQTSNPSLATGVGNRTRMHFDGSDLHLVTSDDSGNLYYLCHTPTL